MISTKQINAGDADYAALNGEVNRKALSAYASELYRRLYRDKYYQPLPIMQEGFLRIFWTTGAFAFSLVSVAFFLGDYADRPNLY